MENWRFKDEWLLRGLKGVKGLDEAFVTKAREGKRTFIAQAVVEAGVLGQENLLRQVEASFKIKPFMVSPEKVDKFGLKLVQERTCRKYSLLPVGIDDSEIRVVMLNPLDFNAISDLEALTARRVIPLFCPGHILENCEAQVFSAEKTIYALLNQVEVPEDIQVLEGMDLLPGVDAEVSSPVITLVNSIISQAYKKRSSDIHIEHDEKTSHVRIRVDGMLRNIMTLPRFIATGPVVSRIKIMGGMDVSNHLRPQDGRAKLRVGGAEIGLRVSTLPTNFGEKVVIRILDQRAAEVPFEKLGFAPEVVAGIDKCLNSAQGILLVTGPTGSGKTTTLYSVMNKCKDESTNIVTAEDPIEYKLKGINQVQVNERQGLTFASVLRSVLRQDPDIILVGEIRDKETADIAFQAAMTGHLVLSTLHTNDSVSTISRLVDMGVDRFKISPGLLAVTAQRLVRKLCPACAEKVPTAEADRSILAEMSRRGIEPVYYRKHGCQNCENTGYAGRTSIVELLMVTPKVKDLINSGARKEEIESAALASGALRTMTHDGLWQMSQGRTDIAELEPYISITHAAPAPAAGTPAAVPAPARAAAPAPAVGPAAAAAPAPAPAAGGKPVVLVAEDDAIMRMLLKKFIESAGFVMKEAVDGEAALTAIAEQAPDLLLSDIHMPRLNGLDLVKGVRQNLGLAELPIIMLTTETSDKSQELAFNLGADDYIMKPFKGPLVVARITAALRRAGKLG